MNGEISMGTEGLSDAIEALGEEMAIQLAALAEQSCEVAGMVVQMFADDEEADTGIHLSAKAIRWIARPGAFLGIDQYP